MRPQSLEEQNSENRRTGVASGGCWKRASTSANSSNPEPFISNCSNTYSTSLGASSDTGVGFSVGVSSCSQGKKTQSLNRKVWRTDATHGLSLFPRLLRLMLRPALLVFRFEGLSIHAVGFRNAVRYLRRQYLSGHEEFGWDGGGWA